MSSIFNVANIFDKHLMSKGVQALLATMRC